MPEHRVFMNLHHNLCEYDSLRNNRHSTSEPRGTRTLTMQQNVLDSFQRNPSNSIGAVAAFIRGSLNSVHRVLQREGLHPYHLQKVQSLLLTDHFALWYLDQCRQDALPIPSWKLQDAGFNVLSPNSVLTFTTFPILHFIYGWGVPHRQNGVSNHHLWVCIYGLSKILVTWDHTLPNIAFQWRSGKIGDLRLMLMLYILQDVYYMNSLAFLQPF